MNPDTDPGQQPSQRDLELMHRHLLGNLEPQEFAELEKGLLASPETRADFLRAARLDAALRDVAAEHHEAPAPVATRFPLWRWLGAAAAVALLVLASSPWWGHANPEAPETSFPIATLIDSRDCQWSGGGSLPVNTRLQPGLLQLTSGIALIEFDGGARLALQGPASLELENPKKARLLQGHTSIRCEEGAEGFSLATPQSTVIDLGTEFGVSVGQDGVTKVEVLEGVIEVATLAPKTESTTRFLAAGDALNISPDGTDSPSATGEIWIRDYTSPSEREALAKPALLLAHDAFAHQGVGVRDYLGGSGWEGPWWKATKSNPGEFYFTTGKPFAKLSAEPGESLVVASGLEVRRKLALPIEPQQPQRLYVAFSLLRLYPKLRDANGRQGEATLLLRSSADPASFIGIGLTGLNRWATSDQGGWERSEKEAKGSGPFLLVARIEFRPARGNSVSLVAFDSETPVPVTEPATWDLVTLRKMSRLSENLDTVALRTRAPSAFKFGEVSIGNSWQSVTDPVATNR